MDGQADKQTQTDGWTDRQSSFSLAKYCALNSGKRVKDYLIFGKTIRAFKMFLTLNSLGFM